MWVSTKTIFNNSIMFFRFHKQNENCVFNFTNLKQFFSKEIHESLFSSTFSSINQLIEVEEENVLKLLENIEETNNVVYNFYTENSTIRANIIITLSEGFPPFKIELQLEIKDMNFFYFNMTYPLLKLIKILKNNQNYLFEQLEKKDLEIAEYILEGGNITQKNIKTNTFEKDNFMKDTLTRYQDLNDENLNLYEIYSSPFFEHFSDRYCEENEILNNKLNNEYNKEIIQIPPKKKSVNNEFTAVCSTTMEMTQASINVKKRKASSFLKNL